MIVGRGAPQSPEMIIFLIGIVIAIPFMILWGKYILRPIYIFLNKKIDKPIFNEKYENALAFEPRGKVAIIHSFMSFLPMLIVTYIIPELIFPGKYTLWLPGIFGIMCLYAIIHLREDIFIKAKITKNFDNTSTIEHFQHEGYSLTYFIFLGLINLVPLCVWGIDFYILYGQSKYLITIIICLIVEFLIVFPEITDKFMPFDLKTRNGWWLFLMITTLISFGVAFRIAGITY